jgi:hypothetical protein
LQVKTDSTRAAVARKRRTFAMRHAGWPISAEAILNPFHGVRHEHARNRRIYRRDDVACHCGRQPALGRLAREPGGMAEQMR